MTFLFCVDIFKKNKNYSIYLEKKKKKSWLNKTWFLFSFDSYPITDNPRYKCGRVTQSRTFLDFILPMQVSMGTRKFFVNELVWPGNQKVSRSPMIPASV